MRARVQTQGEVTVVDLEGRIDFETSAPFRKVCMESWANRKLVFNLSNLSFVGSHGITDFVQTIEVLSEKSDPTVKICGLSSEFRRIFESRQIKKLEIFDSAELALASFL